jgi:hypothetical protein
MMAIIRSIVMTISYSGNTMMVIPWCVIGRIPITVITMMVAISETTDPETNAASLRT